MSGNSCARYYRKNKERLQKWCMKNLFKEEKKKRRQYGPEQNENLSENQKQTLVEYRKKTIK